MLTEGVSVLSLWRLADQWLEAALLGLSTLPWRVLLTFCNSDSVREREPKEKERAGRAGAGRAGAGRAGAGRAGAGRAGAGRAGAGRAQTL